MSRSLELNLALEDRGAHFSEDRRYRYSLWRTWDPDGPLLGWIMLNPSTADADTDDPTIRRCTTFAKRDGYGGIIVTNLFSLRATDPRHLLEADDPVGGFDPYEPLAFTCSRIVAAWGSVHRSLRARAEAVGSEGWPLYCLGRTRDGSPRHPLYVRATQPLVRWAEARP